MIIKMKSFMLILLLSLVLAPFSFPDEKRKVNPSPKPRKSTPLKIESKPSKPIQTVLGQGTPANITDFVLVPIQNEKNAYWVKFISRNPNLFLNPRGRFFIELDVDPPLEVLPKIIRAKDWSKDQVKVLLKGTPSKDSHELWGFARFTLCHKKTKACKTEEKKFYYDFTSRS